MPDTAAPLSAYDDVADPQPGRPPGLRRVIAVVGCQRSGTTLTGQILGAYPKAVLIDENDGLYDWAKIWLRDGPVSGTFEHPAIEAAMCKYRKPKHRFLRHDDGRVSLGPSVKHLVLKAPNLTYEYEALARAVPPVSVIYPVRDVRAVVTSMMRLSQNDFPGRQAAGLAANPSLSAEFGDELDRLRDDRTPQWVKCALVWRIKSAMADRFRKAGLPVLQFQYERLVEDPRGTIEALAQFAGLGLHEALFGHGAVYLGRGPGGTDRRRPVDEASVDLWRWSLSPEQERDVLKAAGPLMEELGYDTAPGARPSAAVRAFRDDPIVLLGRGGSGTRLLIQLASPARIFMGGRLNAFGDSLSWTDLIYDMAVRTLQDGTDDALAKDWTALLRQHVERLIRANGLSPDALWGWKLPETMLVVPRIAEAFPNAKFIHLIRHPVTSALRRTHKTSRADNVVGAAVMKAAYAACGLPPDLIESHPEHMHNAVTWLFQVRRVVEFARAHLPADRYLEVRYEDICADPEATQRQVLDFLGCSIPNTEPPAIEAGRTRAFELSDPRADEVWSLCGDFAASIGYAPLA